jgi:pimeloyl-ACP methyl ester carboxylesterase
MLPHSVPKDYYNASAGFATIAVSKRPASVPASERLGSIFLNPGGPGGSGFEFTFRIAPYLSDILEGRYDLIGFDPRGIGQTVPKVLCFSSKLAYQMFKAGTVLDHGFNIGPDPFSSEGRFHLLEQHRELLALQQAEYERCGEAMGDELRYMSTSTVVRDIEEMSRAFEGEDAPM